jgi:uncharacterized protein YjlB
MPVLQDVKEKVERLTGIWRPSKDEAEAAVRQVTAKTYRFGAETLVPNNPRLPLVHFKRALKFAKKFDPAAVIEELFEANGWGESWRNGIYDWMHFHAHTHEVLGVARGHARVLFGGSHGREIAIAAGDVIVLPAGTGHQRLKASDDLLVVGAYPPGGDYDERAYGGPAALKAIAKVPLPKCDPIYGKRGGIMKLWACKTKARGAERQ